MRYTLNLLLCLTLFATSLSAQKKELKVKFGKISEEEINMKSCPIDPAAPAVVLFDKGHISHRYVTDRGFIFEFDRHTRIKIFSKEAYYLADAAIFFFESQKIGDLKASSFNLENGKIVETKISKDNVFDEKLTRSRMVKKITIPAVREGSIIELKYTLTDEGSGIQDWAFQRQDIPTIWSEFEASVPTFIEYRKMSQGWEPFAVAEENTKTDHLNISFSTRSSGLVVESKNVNARVEYNTNNMHFIQENLPALKPEQFVHSVRDYLSQINFDIRAVYETDLVHTGGDNYRLENRAFRERNISWERLGLEMFEDVYGDAIKSEKYTDAETKKCVSGLTTDAEKIAAVYAFIGQNYQGSNRDYLWPSQKPDELVKNRKGTPTDLNLLFINMLRRAGLKAYPLMISTRGNGRVLSFRVTTDAFNRVIAAVEGADNQLTLMDVTGWPNPPGLLPEEDLNGEGLLMKEKEIPTWIPLQNKNSVRHAVMADLSLHPGNGLAGLVTFSETGYGAAEARVRIREKDAQSFVQEKFKTLIADGRCSDLKVENVDLWQDENLKGTFQLETSAFMTVSGDKIYLNPALGFGIQENPFKNPERKFNVDLGTPDFSTWSFTIKIPAGYKVEELPKAAKMTFGENGLLFQYIAEATAEAIRIVIRQQIKNPYIQVEHYADLKQFFGDWAAKLEEQVVLTKI